jgi:hypothetical protein
MPMPKSQHSVLGSIQTESYETDSDFLNKFLKKFANIIENTHKSCSIKEDHMLLFLIEIGFSPHVTLRLSNREKKRLG